MQIKKLQRINFKIISTDNNVFKRGLWKNSYLIYYLLISKKQHKRNPQLMHSIGAEIQKTKEQT